MSQRLGVDPSTASVRQAAGIIAEAVFEREHYGVTDEDAQRDAIERVERALAAFKAGTISDTEREWLESIGVQA